MPLCKNNRGEKNVRYSTKASTPHGDGYCARFEAEGKRRRSSANGRMYKVVVNSKGVKSWRAVASRTTASIGKPKRLSKRDQILKRYWAMAHEQIRDPTLKRYSKARKQKIAADYFALMKRKN